MSKPIKRPRTTIAQVASACGVSPTTASRVLRGSLGRIPAQTGKRIRLAAERLGWHPPGPGPLAMDAHTILLAVRDGLTWDGTIYADFVDQCSMAADAVGFDLEVRTIDDGDVLGIASLLMGGVGVLVHESLAEVFPNRTSSRAVAVNWPETPSAMDAVTAADAAAVASIMETAVLFGHRRFALVMSPASRHGASVAARRRAFNHGVAACGGTGLELPADAGIIARSMRGRDGVTMVLAYSGTEDVIAILTAARTCGLAFPRDFSLACCDTTPLISLHHPAITACRHRLEDMIAWAVGRLHQRAAGDQGWLRHERLFPVDVVQTSSLAAVPAGLRH